jgi:hypothetical protein
MVKPLDLDVVIHDLEAGGVMVWIAVHRRRMAQLPPMQAFMDAFMNRLDLKHFQPRPHLPATEADGTAAASA